MFKFIKAILVDYLAQDIASKIRTDTKASSNAKNLAGPGGQQFRPYYIDWTWLVENHPNRIELKRWYWSHDKFVAKEQIFFDYFGPLEHWCDANCVSDYYLWSDSFGIFLQFTNETDRVLWKLTFHGPMPTYQEIDELVKNNINARTELEK